MPLAEAREVVDRAWRSAWERPVLLPVPEWADRYRIVIGGPSPGLWRTIDAPHCLAPLLDASEPPGGRIRRIVLMFPPQSAKTEIMSTACISRMDQEPADSVFVFEAESTGADFCKSRLVPSIRATPRIAERLIPGARAITENAVRTDAMTLWMLFAGSAGKLSNKPARDGYFDEIDKWPQTLKARGRTEGSALTLARARLDAFGARAREMCASTPTDEHTGIHAEFLASDQAERVYRCPHCGHLQRLRFGDGRVPGGVRFVDQHGERLGREGLLRMPELGLAELKAHVRRTAWYECGHCRGRIESWMRPAMLRAGDWMRAGQEITGEGHASHIAGAAADTGGVRGYHVSWLDVLHKDFGDVAAEWIGHRGETGRDFVNRVMGEPYAQRGAGTSAGALLRHITAQQQEQSMPRGTYPADSAALLIGSIDVQHDHIRWTVAAIGPGESWDLCPRHLVDFGTAPWPAGIMGDDDGAGGAEGELAEAPILPDVRAALLAVVAKEFHGDRGEVGADSGAESPARAEKRGVDYWAIDSGDRTAEVYSLCGWLNRQPGVGVVMAVKGQDRQQFPVERSAGLTSEPTGKLERAALLRHRLGLELLLVRIGDFKDHIHAAVARAAPPAHPAGWTWPRHIDERHIAELCAESRTPVRRDGRTIGYKWENKRRQPNHALDCTVYEQALLCAILGHRGAGGVGGLRMADAPRRWPGTGLTRGGGAAPTRRRGITLGGVRL